MKNHRLIVMLLIMLHLISNTSHVEAYGNTNYTINCPILRFTGTTDRPFLNPITSARYVMGRLIDRTNGFDMTFSASVVRTERIVTPVGSTYVSYIFDQTYNLTPYINVGDVIFVYLYDNTGGLTGAVLSLEFTCGTLSGTTIPSGYTLMTIVCPSNILSSPAGPVLSSYPFVPEVGKQRYVLPLGVMGPDGQVYDKIQANSRVFGFFPRRCLSG